ncbi:hypothetical protein HDU93_004914, partial [Gonapodya sp. JEL0774]
MSTHPFAPSVKAVVNLEACGQGGPEALFQANSEGMVRAYAKSAKWPHGSVMANDVFRTGVLVSDTDFRQFMDYGHEGVVGVDFANYMNSQIYHTILDTASRIEVGSVQHFGDNVLGLVKYLGTEEHLDEEGGYTRGYGTVYTDIFGYFEIVFTVSTMRIVHIFILILSGYTLRHLFVRDISLLPSTPSSPNQLLLSYAVSCASLLLALVLSIFGGLASAALVSITSGHIMTWFKTGAPGMLTLHGWGALLGLFASQYITVSVTRIALGSGGAASYLLTQAAFERRSLGAQVALFSFVLVVGTYYGIGTTWITGLRVACLIASVWLADFWESRNSKAVKSKTDDLIAPNLDSTVDFLPFPAYLIMWTLPFLYDCFFFDTALAIVLPLLGRAG